MAGAAGGAATSTSSASSSASSARHLPHRGASPMGSHGTPPPDRSTRASCRGCARRARTCCAHSARPPPAAPAPARGRAAAPWSLAVGPPIPHVMPVLTAERDRLAVCRPQAPREGFPGRHARQAAARQVGGRRVWRGRILFLIIQTNGLSVCVTMYVN